jgi:hypothetical protein
LAKQGEELVMKTSYRSRAPIVAVLGLAFLASTGCQTWVPAAGVTLPSPHYLKHPPQYIPPDDEFPLTKEAASMEEANVGAAEGGAAR